MAGAGAFGCLSPLGAPDSTRGPWFEPRTAHRTWQCANLGREDAVGREDLRPTVDAKVFDQQTEEGFGLLWVCLADRAFELVGDGFEVGAVGRRGGLWGELLGEPGEEVVARVPRRCSAASVRAIAAVPSPPREYRSKIRFTIGAVRSSGTTRFCSSRR
jgi:hypothetical protein